MFNPGFAARKVGGIWFIRAWRLRLSFCIAKAPVSQPKEHRNVYAYEYLAG